VSYRQYSVQCHGALRNMVCDLCDWGSRVLKKHWHLPTIVQGVTS